MRIKINEYEDGHKDYVVQELILEDKFFEFLIACAIPLLWICIPDIIWKSHLSADNIDECKKFIDDKLKEERARKIKKTKYVKYP